MLLLLSVLILVHELGHFGVARLLGIKVERFGFGLPFGPTLYETVWGKTKICVHAFLLGGYVSFPDDDPDSEIPQDDPGRISNRPVWQRACVVSAGVTANAILAYLIVLMVAGFSGGLPAGKYNIYADGLQADKAYSAYNIGIQKGDKIVSANGVTIDSPVKFITIAKRSKQFDGYVSTQKISEQIKLLKEKNPELKNLKDDQVIPQGTKITLPALSYEEPISISDDAMVGVEEYKPVGIKLTSVQEDLRNSLENKSSYTVNNNITLYDLGIATSDTVHPISITVQRNDKLIELPAAYPNKDGLIGIRLKTEEIIMPVTGVKSAITASWTYLYQNTYYMISGLIKLFTGQVNPADLHGIVAITKVGSDIIEHKGIWNGLLLTALISIDLAIVNLLPIPALDGGHLLFLMIEKLIGRPVNKDLQETFAKYGFMFLIGLMFLIIFNDIVALVTDKL